MTLRGTNSAWWVTARRVAAGVAVAAVSLAAASEARGDTAPTTAESPAAVAGIADSPVSVQAIYLDTEAGPIRGYLVNVDLTDPRVEVVISGGDDDLHDPAAEVVLTPIDDFVSETGCVLAVNANFFRWLENAQGVKTDSDIIGLSVTDGRVVSPARKDGEAGDPAIVFGKDGRARVMYLTPEQVEASGDVWDGVAGTGGGDGGLSMGTLLVVDGVNHGDTALPQPQNRHPRTAAGVDRGGTTLILAVIDGRQPQHSIGITLVELGALMIDAGADDALNLDGGGSTALLVWSGLLADDPTATILPDPDNDGWLTNRPSDSRYRAVANHLGIRLRGVTPPHPPVAFDGTPPATPEHPELKDAP